MFQSCRLQSVLKEDGPDRSLLCFVSINGYTHRLGPQYSVPRQRQSRPWQSRSHRKANPLDCFVPLLAALCEVSPPFESGKVGYAENPCGGTAFIAFCKCWPSLELGFLSVARARYCPADFRASYLPPSTFALSSKEQFYVASFAF